MKRGVSVAIRIVSTILWPILMVIAATISRGLAENGIFPAPGIFVWTLAIPVGWLVIWGVLWRRKRN